MKITFSAIEETLLPPLWGRAKISEEWPSFFRDSQAIYLFRQIDYDFSSIDESLGLEGAFVQAAYAKQFDNKVRTYVARYPEASIVNLGAGLDTAFYRVDNGTLRWYDLDLPRVTALRSTLLPAPERATYLPGSLFDSNWHAHVVNREKGVIILATGVLMYFTEPRIRAFLSSLADAFPQAEFVFDTQPWFASRQGKRIANQAMQEMGMGGAPVKWALREARTITRWDNRVVVVDELPLFKDVPRKSVWGTSINEWMDTVDSHGMSKIVHLRFA